MEQDKENLQEKFNFFHKKEEKSNFLEVASTAGIGLGISWFIIIFLGNFLFPQPHKEINYDPPYASLPYHISESHLSENEIPYIYGFTSTVAHINDKVKLIDNVTNLNSYLLVNKNSMSKEKFEEILGMKIIHIQKNNNEIDISAQYDNQYIISENPISQQRVIIEIKDYGTDIIWKNIDKKEANEFLKVWKQEGHFKDNTLTISLSNAHIQLPEIQEPLDNKDISLPEQNPSLNGNSEENEEKINMLQDKVKALEEENAQLRKRIK